MLLLLQHRSLLCMSRPRSRATRSARRIGRVSCNKKSCETIKSDRLTGESRSTNRTFAAQDPYTFDLGLFSYTFSSYCGETRWTVFAEVVAACQSRLMDELSTRGGKATDPYPYGGFYCSGLTSDRKSWSNIISSL